MPTLTARPSGITVRLDAHHREVVLEVMNEDAVDSAYAISLEAANVVANDILTLLKQVAEEGPAKMQ